MRVFPRMGVNSGKRHSLGTSTTASLRRRQKLSVDSQHPARVGAVAEHLTYTDNM
jgi:hypothetical protein